MQRIVRATDSVAAGSCEAIDAPNCPLPPVIAYFLRDLVREGDPAGRIWLTTLCPIPFTADFLRRPSWLMASDDESRAAAMQWLPERGGDVLSWTIAQALPDLDADGRNTIRQLIADREVREDGRPRFLGHTTADACHAFSQTQRLQRNAGRVAREITAAVAEDLLAFPRGRDVPKVADPLNCPGCARLRTGISSVEAAHVFCSTHADWFDMSSSWLIGLNDHRRHDRAPAEKDLRVSKYIRAGRRLLAALGAWPWTHAPDGKLPAAWREQDAFKTPLFEWHDRRS